MAVCYIDSSALIKLVVREAETSALEAYFVESDGLLASELAIVECGRAAMRAAHARLLQAVDRVLEAVYLLGITQAIMERAAHLDPPTLRSLDAIHLATAASIDDPDLEVITYDDRLADAARANGLTVVQPGLARTRPKASSARVRSR